MARVHPSVIRSLEEVRADLGALIGEEVEIVITGSTRTESENVELAGKLGWIDRGGAVSRHSKHLPKFGGIAVDFYAKVKRTGIRIYQGVLGDAARRHFRFVMDTYEDQHVHADNRP